MGPIECIQFVYDEYEKCGNFAWVVFKFSSSVEDGIKLLHGTKLYGLEIHTNNYSEQQRYPMFNDQLNFFEQLFNVEKSSQSNNGNKSGWSDTNSDNKNYIPDGLSKLPIYSKYNSNNYIYRSKTMPRHDYEDNSSKYQCSNFYTKNHSPVYRNEHHLIYQNHYSSGYYQRPEHNCHSDSMVSSNNHKYDYKNKQDYNLYIFSNWKKSKSANDVKPVRDLRDLIHQKRSLDLDNYNDTNTNASCTSRVKLKDTKYHSKNDSYKDIRSSFQSDSKSQMSEKNRYAYSIRGYSDKPYRKDNYASENYKKSSTKHQEHYARREYRNKSFNQDKSYDSFQDHDSEYSNHYDDYDREKKRYNKHIRRENMEFGSWQKNSHHLHKHYNEGQEEKEYKNSYNERSRYSHNRSNIKGDSDRSKHYYL